MEDEGCVVRVRGLPWSATQDEVASFFGDCEIVDGKEGIHFTYVRDGRPSGEAYVNLASEEDVEKAVSKDKHHMGKRYIDVFRSKRSEMDWVVKRSGVDASVGGAEAVIRLRGLPFGCSKEEIAQFFTGLEIIPNGITLIQDAQGRTTGDAYVQFSSPEIADRALCKHKEKIGHRYIEIFKSSQMEVRNAVNMMNRMMGVSMNRPMARPSPYDRADRFGGGGGGGGMGMGPMRGGMRGRGNIKGYFDDGMDDFGGGYGGGRGGMGRGGMGGGGGGGMGMGKFGAMGDYDSQTGHSVHLRGLPFAATEQDIIDFFKPLVPHNVVIHYQSDGRASGEADADFATHEEAKQAMSKDRGRMEHRYIELFLKSADGMTGTDEMYDQMEPTTMGMGAARMGGAGGNKLMEPLMGGRGGKMMGRGRGNWAAEQEQSSSYFTDSATYSTGMFGGFQSGYSDMYGNSGTAGFGSGSTGFGGNNFGSNGMNNYTAF